MRSDPKADLDAMPRDIDPPAALEQRITADLLRRGLLSSRIPRGLLLAAAALIPIAFVAGLLVGRTESRAPKDHYLLLLYQGPAFRGGAEQDLVAEYGAWARELRRDGHLVEGRRLQEPRARLGNAPPEVETLSGFFRVRAESLTAAEDLARTCPHLDYGGTVEVRAIDPGI